MCLKVCFNNCETAPPLGGDSVSARGLVPQSRSAKKNLDLAAAEPTVVGADGILPKKNGSTVLPII